MDSSDRKKLIAAGFRILRIHPKDIRELNLNGGWNLVSRHNTVTETERALAILRQDPKTIVE